jgi:hypothetical protein
MKFFRLLLNPGAVDGGGGAPAPSAPAPSAPAPAPTPQPSAPTTTTSGHPAGSRITMGPFDLVVLLGMHATWQENQADVAPIDGFSPCVCKPA